MKTLTTVICSLTFLFTGAACVSGGGGGSGSPNEDVGASTNDVVSVDSSAPTTDLGPAEDTAPTEPESAPDPIKAYSGGTCPELKPGPNTLMSGGMERNFYLHVPNEPTGAGVTFLWHGFGDSVQNFSAGFNANQMSNEAHMIVVTPEPAIAVPMVGIDSWSFISLGDTEADLIFFDDMLACLEDSFDINEKTVYTMGFSAGGLFSSMLLLERGRHITAGVVFSGGTDAANPDLVAIPYQNPGHKMPVLIAHGGQSDVWGGGPILVEFNTGSIDLANQLSSDGHPVILCDHGGGHTVPAGGVNWAWEFIRTSYWSEGESQWIGHNGEPFPAYCTFPQ